MGGHRYKFLEMTINEFTKKIEEILEDEPPGSLTPDTDFRKIESWSSMYALIIVAMFETDFRVTVTGDQLRKCSTVRDLYQLLPTN